MGNKLSCSCAPLIRSKTYRYEDSPWQAGARGGMGGGGGRRGDTGHLLRCGSLRERKRLWAEVFHVNSSGAGTVKWQQVSEDLVPVNITCIQDSPECVFHITAYNSQVDKILDVRLVQPGTRIGQASECFVYWKDTVTNDTWGLNFTSPIDAKQFRECCSPSFKISRKASSSYSLKLEPPNKQKIKTRRKPLSTPASPSRSREPQCTCMTPEQFARLRSQDPRYRSPCGPSTLPRTMARSTEMEMTPGRDKITAATSSASLYDNVNNPSATPGKTPKTADSAKQKDKQNETCQTTPKTANVGIGTVTVGSQIDSPDEKGSTISPKKSQKQSQDSSTQQNGTEMLKSEGTQAGGTLQSKLLRKEQLHHTKSADYTELEMQNGNLFNIVNNNHGHRSKSKSTDDMRIENAQNGGISLDPNTLKRMLKPMPSIDSPVTSPEMTRKRHSHHSYHYHPSNNNQKYMMQEVDNENYAHPYRAPYNNKFQGSRSVHDMSRQYPGGRSRTYLDSERNRCTGDMSPPSDNVIFDNQCYATTPSSSNGNSDMEQPNHCNSRRCNGGQTYQQQNMQSVSTPGSPTSRLLLEYEMHLRNTLAKGMDAESYSLRTFEALLTQSMENLEFAENIPLNVQRTPHVSRRRSNSNKSSTLPLSYRYCNERQNSKDRDGYYSDRNEMVREKRERDSDRDRGYLSDYNSRCASCIGESARAQWFRHSDGWQSGSSTLGSGASSSINPGYSGYKRESPWDSLPSLRHEGSLNDSGYKSNRTDSLEQRGTFDRQDSVRSDYMSDRDGRYGIVQQASLESTDSRLCYLTSSEMSDDDRMSLTTAVSDDDDGESVINSPYRGKQTGTAAASFNCTGAVRKAGFLSVKKWLLRKKHQIELARKRGWKGYWVCLKGTTLLFYPCDSQESRAMEAAPKHLIIVDGAIMQPIPEHPKRDYIFCLSTAFGDAYLFQAPCQVELENWVNSIHSACAAAFARHRGKTGTLHLLQEEIFRLEKAIESDHKMKHMADLQQSVVSDVDTKQQINNQIVQWEENLERLHCEQFRLRCYMASLQSGELPNPKSLLTHVSRATKQTLNKLGVFTVSSFHAFICARSPSLLNNLLAGRGATKRRPPLLSRSNSGSSRRSLQISSRDEEKSVKVSVPENQVRSSGHRLVSVFLRDAMTVEEFLASACTRKNLNPMEHFVRVKKRRDMEDHNYFVPHRTDLIETYLHTHEIVEVCAKILYQVELQRNTLEQMWGFSVEAELIENSDRQDELCCYVSRVEDKSVAMQNGIIKGDEIMVINGAIVSDLDMMYLESVLQEEVGLCMMMRSSRTEPPDLTGIMRVTDDIIESLVCPPPPTDPPVISEEMISGLIVPAPGWSKENIMQDCSAAHMENSKQTSRTNSFEIENLLKTAEQVTGICRSPGETRKSSPTGSVVSSHSQALTPSRQLSDAEKLKKVILELIETERTYVKNLNNLLENYLEPLKRETFLSNAEINALFGNIQEIVTFQRQFLQNLDHAIEMEADFNSFDHPSQFKGVLFSIGSAFLYYVNHFKLYSSFCASHSKAQKVLHPNEGNQALQEFLQARNPRQQHSSTLESYLIKPIQRILKYPLLLQQLRNLTDERSEEHQHLIEALKGMEKVAEHINEMQRIHEEYGAIFDHLFRQHQKSCKQPIDLSPGDLLYYGGVEWLNISDFLGKIKKGLELHAMCFVFKSAVVFLCKERLRQKKKLMGVSTKANSSEVEIIRYQVLIPVTEVQVRASSAKDMESHFLWELIHLRSQLQRRSEKVYVLSNSTTEFRNAFLKTIRQIIRESVRNMSIPSTKQNMSHAPMSMAPRMSTGHVEKFDKQQIGQTQNGNGSITGTLSKKAMKQQLLANSHKRKYSHSKQPVEHESSEDKDQEDAPVVQQQTTFRSRSKTISDTSSEIKVEMDSGTKSEGEEDSQAFLGEKKTNLGRTPNHLTLSTTSTISAGSTGSQARLIQSSHQPENYQPITVKELGSPIWKPRELPSLGEATTLPRKGKSAGEFADMSSSHSASRKSLIEINNCAQQPNFNNHV
ncbi:protein still life, isoform SIF type 1 isoform X1 [Camponotus floridanus]|uniref:protein still life, isoform SIF type 1 isoform X1 n=1 Tax=Camponotus floridanus TaxID=104421 RepID=UPI000DC681CC|nr:protein still life, isoform SIF type 1 isoform X1 [Camponotus floridanus]XP_011262670.2 protein still life, isoform SIF type 1 isoform X1 [Camponotus floridanus]XP_011262671.2 protein still life, isoform SIF type 1 isoform X1 [Camponotus floridanus]XP_011262672.2 protein still life, isoform SIF type 1 isoform X1 [Camponotus floridanus]XP_025267513.1 protein still life, isoform SIF type 1 isoform X1 [Camponotus floridanus]XP_025267514.1 protein still life, isoform SIF type 1 isoform X1 [Camp